MTRRTSAVAVCCSSASRVSLNRRTLSTAISAWSTKVCISAISRALKACTVVRTARITPMHSSSRMMGSISEDRMPSEWKMRCSNFGSG